jgi:putative acetyltransferase
MGADLDPIAAVLGAAFAGPRPGAGPPVEVELLRRLRADAGWLPALSLVAVDPEDGQLTGQVVCTRGTVAALPALGLGPLAVRPDRQRRGVGSALMHAVLGAAQALGEPLVGLLGDPRYYARFGFRPGSQVGILAPNPGWGPNFQVRILTPGIRAAGVFRYAAPFERL